MTRGPFGPLGLLGLSLPLFWGARWRHRFYQQPKPILPFGERVGVKRAGFCCNLLPGGCLLPGRRSMARGFFGGPRLGSRGSLIRIGRIAALGTASESVDLVGRVRCKLRSFCQGIAILLACEIGGGHAICTRGCRNLESGWAPFVLPHRLIIIIVAVVVSIVAPSRFFDSGNRHIGRAISMGLLVTFAAALCWSRGSRQDSLGRWSG